MATLAAFDQEPRRLTIEEFLRIDFGPGLKAELVDGIIRMMAGGTRKHAALQANILSMLRPRLRGSGCRPYGSDMAVRTRGDCLRYPDVTVECGDPNAAPTDRFLAEPRIIFEVLSPSTRGIDLRIKRDEYKALTTLDTLVFIDAEGDTVEITQRTATGWSEVAFAAIDVPLPALDITLPHAEIFALD